MMLAGYLIGWNDSVNMWNGLRADLLSQIAA